MVTRDLFGYRIAKLVVGIHLLRKLDIGSYKFAHLTRKALLYHTGEKEEEKFINHNNAIYTS